MKPEYANFAALQARHVQGRDYTRKRRHSKNSEAIIIAPHAGKIEPFTGSIARDIAGDEFSLYTFSSGVPTSIANLHVTSHRFDDPRCVALVSHHRLVIAIHGCKGEGCRVFIGGRDQRLAEAIGAALRKSGVRAATTGHKYLGSDRMNICNRGMTGKGVQLELTRGLRRRRAGRLAVVKAVRDVLLAQKKL